MPQNIDYHLLLLADYGGDARGVNDLAFAEVEDRLAALAQQANISLVTNRLSVRAFNTVEAGLVIAQLGLNSPLGANKIIYHNIAPRKDELAARANNAGEGLAVAQLPNGVLVIGVNAGYCHSFLGADIELYAVQISNDGTQFRSRDNYPAAVIALAAHLKSGGVLEDWPLLGRLLPAPPPPPADRIAYDDGYGNLKLTTAFNDLQLPAGQTVFVACNGVVKAARVVGGSFAVQDGELAVSAGSSGWGSALTELFLRGGDARAAFGNPAPGATALVASESELRASLTALQNLCPTLPFAQIAPDKLLLLAAYVGLTRQSLLQPDAASATALCHLAAAQKILGAPHSFARHLEQAVATQNNRKPSP